MAIPFKEIPAGLLVPGQYQEVSRISQGNNKKIALLMGMMRSDAPAQEGEEYTLTGPSQAEEFFGEGSDLAVMAAGWLEANKVEELRALPLKEKADGVAAEYTLQFTLGDKHEGGTIPLYLNGIQYSFGISDKDSLEALLTKAQARIQNQRRGSVNAKKGLDGESLVLTYRHKGETGNHLDIRLGLYGEELPSGVSLSWEQTQTGSGNPDMAAAIAGMKEVRYNWMATNLTDGPNMAKLEEELNRRYTALEQKGGRLFVPVSGTEEELIAWADAGRNNPHVSVLPRGLNPQSPLLWVGRGGALIARQLAGDPAVNLSGLALGLKATQTLGFESRQRLLEKGLSTYTCGADGLASVERQVTNYTTDRKGNRDTSYLDIQIPETIDAIREHINIKASQVYEGYKQASTDENFGAGAKVMTPSLFKSFLLSTYKEDFIQNKGWCQNFDAYKESLIVEPSRENGKTRINYSHEPVLMGQFLIAAGRMQAL